MLCHPSKNMLQSAPSEWLLLSCTVKLTKGYCWTMLVQQNRRRHAASMTAIHMCRNGTEYISTIEGVQFPFFGTQASSQLQFSLLHCNERTTQLAREHTAARCLCDADLPAKIFQFLHAAIMARRC